MTEPQMEVIFSDAPEHARPLAARILDPFRQLWSSRELIYSWTLREIQIRYKQTMLGGVWAVLQPLSLMLVFSLIFTFLVKVPTDGVAYPVFSYCALLPWTFFATSISFGSTSLVQNMNLVTKVYFPREILPLGVIGSAFLDLLLASIVFILLIVFYKVPMHWTIVWVPVLVLVQLLLTVGVTLLAAAVMVFYRDVRFVVPLGLQLWMYATPIIYPLGLVPPWLRPVYLLNPLAGLVDSYRRVVLYGQAPDGFGLGIAAAVSVVVAALAYWLFKRLEWRFADAI